MNLSLDFSGGVSRPSMSAYVLSFLDSMGGGGGVTSVYVRLCPVLFGFYETTDVFFGTLAFQGGTLEFKIVHRSVG